MRELIGGEEIESVRQGGPARLLLVLVIAAVVILADQGVKAIVSSTLQHGDPIDLLGGFVRLDYTRNSGAAFGIFQAAGPVFAGAAVAVSGGILLYAWTAHDKPPTMWIALGLILGGAIGNLVDRVHLGYVIDFIDLRWWPVFNLADSSIVLGIALLIVHSALSRSEPEP